MAKNYRSSVISALDSEISAKADSFKGQDPEVIKTQLKEIFATHGLDNKKWKELVEGSTILQFNAPKKDPEAIGGTIKGAVINKNLDNELDALSKQLSEGLENSKEGKKDKFKIPLSKGEIQNLRSQDKSQAIEALKAKITEAATAAGWELSELQSPQPNINFKNFGSRSVSINTTGVPFVEALAEVVYNSAVNENELNADNVKSETEQSLGTAPETGMETGDMISDMINGGGPGGLEQNEMGMTYSPD